MKRNGVLASILLAAIAIPVAADVDVYRYYKTLPVGEITADDYVSIVIDRDMYAGSRVKFEDVRITDDRDTEIPFVFERLTSNEVTRVRLPVSSTVSSLENLEDNRIVVLISATGEKPPVIHGLQIDTPLKDFEKRVSVFGVLENGERRELAANAFIFDYSRFMDVRDTTIPLPPGVYRSFRVELQDVTDDQASPLRELQRTYEDDQEIQRVDKTTLERRDFRIDRISLWTEEEREYVKVDCKTDYAMEGFEVSDDREKKKTVITVRTHREPLTELTIGASGQSFSRRAEVQVPVNDGIRTSWRSLSKGTISRISYREFNRIETTLTFPEQRSGHYRIVIDNRDNPPLHIDGISARGNSYRVLFMAAPARSYVLRYGSESARLPDYDAAAILGALRRGYEPRNIIPGEQVENPAFKPEGGGAKFFNGKIFFGLVIALVVLTLGFALYRAGKHVDGSQGSDT